MSLELAKRARVDQTLVLSASVQGQARWTRPIFLPYPVPASFTLSPHIGHGVAATWKPRTQLSRMPTPQTAREEPPAYAWLSKYSMAHPCSYLRTSNWNPGLVSKWEMHLLASGENPPKYSSHASFHAYSPFPVPCPKFLLLQVHRRITVQHVIHIGPCSLHCIKDELTNFWYSQEFLSLFQI